jgi:DNA-binding GntR family transcriptional regulator
VTPVHIPSVVDEVFRKLRDLILSGVFKPGGRLVEEALTAQLGVSRPPLREALRSLERDGLVRSIPRRGFIVEPLTASDVREIYSLRWALERLAVDIGVPVRDPALLAPMRQALSDMNDAARAGDADGMLRANAGFHQGMVGLAQHKRLNRAYDALSMQLQMCMAINLRFREQQHQDPADAVQRHRRLLELIEAGDSGAVQDEIKSHGHMSFMDRLDEFFERDE